MQIPKRVKIGPYSYTVEFPHNFKEHEDCRGDINYSLNRVRIDDRCEEGYFLTAARVWQTFAHEMVHAILDHAQIGLDEQQVDRVAAIALDIFINNDWLEPEIDIGVEEQKGIKDYKQQLKEIRSGGTKNE